MYKESTTNGPGREAAIARLPRELVRRFDLVRQQLIEQFGRVLGRAHVADYFDRVVWPDETTVEGWLAMAPAARHKRLERLVAAVQRAAESSEEKNDLEAELRSRRADNDDSGELPTIDELDDISLSVEGFIIHEEPPASRAECPDYRPCPYVSCRYHLYLDVTRRGRLRMNFPETEIIDLPMSCALDVAKEGPKTLEQIGKIMGGISRERVRQIEQAALEALRMTGGRTLVDFLSERATELEHAEHGEEDELILAHRSATRHVRNDR